MGHLGFYHQLPLQSHRLYHLCVCVFWNGGIGGRAEEGSKVRVRITLVHSILETALSGPGDLEWWRAVDHCSQVQSSLSPTGLCLNLHSDSDPV